MQRNKKNANGRRVEKGKEQQQRTGGSHSHPSLEGQQESHSHPHIDVTSDAEEDGEAGTESDADSIPEASNSDDLDDDDDDDDDDDIYDDLDLPLSADGVSLDHSLSFFNVVFVLSGHTPAPLVSMYGHVAKLVARAFLAEQLRVRFVAQQAQLLFTIREKSEKGG